jgi:hypothetical protein
MRSMIRYLRTHKFSTVLLACALAMVLVSGGIRVTMSGVSAGPIVVGNPNGSGLRALVYDYALPDGFAPTANDSERIVYFDDGEYTMVNTTPVASDPQCGLGGYTIFDTEVRLTGTMAGTNPTFTVVWQNSLDGGETWTNVGTWTAINATVTPAVQRQTVSDIVGSTAVASGDCWRAQYTFGGTGTVVINIGIKGQAK